MTALAEAVRDLDDRIGVHPCSTVHEAMQTFDEEDVHGVRAHPLSMQQTRARKRADRSFFTLPAPQAVLEARHDTTDAVGFLKHVDRSEKRPPPVLLLLADTVEEAVDSVRSALAAGAIGFFPSGAPHRAVRPSPRLWRRYSSATLGGARTLSRMPR